MEPFMARRNSSSVGHLLLRITGLNALMAAAAGVGVWRSLGETDIGAAIFFVAAALVIVALLGELGGIIGLAGSRRGAAGINVALQIALAVILVIGVNVFSFGKN